MNQRVISEKVWWPGWRHEALAAQTASSAAVAKFLLRTDSLLEESEFEPSVPPVNELVSPAGTRMRTRRQGRSRRRRLCSGDQGFESAFLRQGVCLTGGFHGYRRKGPQAYLTVLEHGETIALRARNGALANDVEAHVGLGSGDEDRALLSDRGPPAIVAIALIKDIARPRLDRDRAPDLGVVDVGIGDVEDARIIGLRVKDDMHLQAADAPVRFGPTAQFAERNGGRIDQLDHRRAVASRLPIELAGHPAEGLGEEPNRAPFVRIAQGRAHQRTAAQMVMMLTVGVPTRFQAAQADGRGE